MTRATLRFARVATARPVPLRTLLANWLLSMIINNSNYLQRLLEAALLNALAL
jgi:hypothetical protein